MDEDHEGRRQDKPYLIALVVIGFICVCAAAAIWGLSHVPT